MNIGRLQVNYYPPIEVEPIKSSTPEYWKAWKISLRVRPPLMFKRGEELFGMKLIYNWVFQLGGLDVRLFRKKNSVTQEELDAYNEEHAPL